ncbi:UvrD-helicase domain-containing protein, partial [candidate division KSB1 bacterium]|nr:UvrD-helicase domain-containing protein [candidate division KSB1 bacterium]
GDSVSNSFYELLANRIRFLLIDEFQDTSVLQLKILLPIIREVSSGEGVKPYGGVIVVGDEKQSIYGWRGGERDLLLAMPGLLQVEEEPPLTKSFRSRPVIMHFINDFFANPALHESLAQRGIEWPYQRCSTSSTQDDGAVWVRFHNVSKQTNNAEDEEDAQPHTSAHNELAEEIHALIQAGKILPSQTAVLTRTNKDLDRLAAAFDELGLDYIHESSHAIPQHRAIKPMMYLLNYLAGWNFDDLLKFLRSDYILISATELKRILEAYRQINKNPSEQPIWRELAAALPECAILQRTAAAIEKSLRLDLVNLCRMILKDFAVLRKFHLENDAKNIHHFLEIVAAFCEQRQYLVTPAGFIRYCHDHRLEEELQQIGLDEVEALQLLTIHKAKGKEFENVFVFLDTTGGGRGQERGIRCYLRYGSAFRDIEEYAVTFLYDKVLQNCSMKPLYEEQKRRDAIEALNTFYVAITRAGSNLGLFMTFENKKGIEEWCKQNAKSDEVVMERMLVELLYNQLKTEERLYEKNLSGARAFIGRYAAIEQKAPTSVAKDVQFAREYLDTERRVHYRPRPLPEEDVFLNYKSMFLKKRSMDRGIVVHYYLSFIKYDSAAARQWAAQQTIAYYGSLVPVAEIRALIERADDCMARHAELFSAQHWSAAFTEYTLFAADGREQRIDRLLVSDERKEILIVDFKTGEAHDQRQLQAYIETVRSLPYVTSNGYGVRGIFVEVSL